MKKTGNKLKIVLEKEEEPNNDEQVELLFLEEFNHEMDAKFL